MKKLERRVSTDRLDAILVTHQAEESDFAQQKPFEIPESYLMLGPPGGPLARIDGVDAGIVMLLLTMLQAQPGQAHGRLMRPLPVIG